VYSGTSITLTVGINECFPTPTFNWYKVGSSASVCNTQTFTKANISAADSGNYNVVVENLAGKVTSNNAHVIVNTLQLTVDKGTGGNITAPTSSPIGVNYGAATTITAVPSTGYNFVKWTIPAGTAAIADSFSASTTITLTSGNATVKANFAIKIYKLTVSATTGGTTVPSGSPVTVEYNAATAVTASPDPAYDFQTWAIISGSPAIASTTNASTAITLTSGDATVKANFVLKTYNLNISVTPTGTGTVLLTPAGPTYSHGTIVTLTPNANTGYRFSSWAGGVSLDNNITMDDAKNITANFTAISYPVHFDRNGGMSGGEMPDQLIPYKSSANLTVCSFTRTGLTFIGWSTTSGSQTRTYGNGGSYQMATTGTTIYAQWRVMDADSNEYDTVRIGTQTWMKQNLKTTKYNDGIAIPNVIDSLEWYNLSTSAYCWYNNDITNRNPYGALYNWFAVNTGKLSPTGWHIANDAEWTTLISFLGGESIAGGKLKESGSNHWNEPNSGATNESNFIGLGAGYRTAGPNGTPSWSISEDLKNAGIYWSANPFDNSNSMAHCLGKSTTQIFNTYFPNGYGNSVRCIRD
jgi:uncharacterized protein (TIGR02145 family)